MISFLLADGTADTVPWAASAAVMTLSGVVVWLAKAYRDDMKERAVASAESHEKVATEFKRTSEETRDKFLASLERQDGAIDKLSNSIDEMNRRIKCAAINGG